MVMIDPRNLGLHAFGEGDDPRIRAMETAIRGSKDRQWHDHCRHHEHWHHEHWHHEQWRPEQSHQRVLAASIRFDLEPSETFPMRSEREQFVQDGFVRLSAFVPQDDLCEIQRQLAEFINQDLPKLPREDVFYEQKGDRSTLKQIQRLHEHSPFFGEMMNQGQFPELAADLLDDDVVAKNLQFFNKPPGISQPTPPHQDGYYFMLEPCEAVTMWFALDQTDDDNGCVRYVRGSHRDGMRAHCRTNTLGFSQGLSDFGGQSDLEREVAAHAEPGDLLVHHALTVHWANRNESRDRQRRSLGFVYFAKRARVDEQAAAEYQAKLKSDLVKAGKL